MSKETHRPVDGDVTRVTHLVSDLEVGGAQALLSALLERMDRPAISSTVISLRSDGEYAETIRKVGVPVLEGDAGSAYRILSCLPGTVAQIRRSEPDVLHTWLYFPSLVGSIYSTLVNRTKLVWGLHRSVLSPDVTRLRVRGTARILGLLSSSRAAPDRTVYCSPEAKAAHDGFGFEISKSTVIENGVDTDRFKPDDQAKQYVRRQLGLEPGTALIGLVARFHPIKGHRTFLDAAASVQSQCPDVAFLLCGENVSQENATLRMWAEERNLSTSLHLLGVRRDIERITAALDVAVCASRDESFSLTVAEAMACEVPCVATDLSAPVRMLGATGRVVPVGNPDAMAAAICELLALEPAARRTMGRRARKRIENRWSIDRTAEQFMTLYRDLDR